MLQTQLVNISIQPFAKSIMVWVVTAREVTFTCNECGQTVTQERMPGPLPSYCSDRCRLDAAAARKKAVRATIGKNKGKRGRPRKIDS